jgi:Holliday junction resolvase RusA-like endonuclease
VILERMTDRHIVTIQVSGRPATFATAHEKPWKDAVRSAIAASGVQPQDARFAVRLEFRLAAARNANEVWDLDNLIKPTLDAMEGVFGSRPWRGTPQPADDRVDRIEAAKRLPSAGEVVGATIDVWVIEPD